MISVRDLSHRYPGGTTALAGVNVEFQRDGTSAVLGESGSGKTTLLMCLARFLNPRRGTITLDGTDIREIPEREFRGKVGVVFQKLHLFPHLTVLQNMTLAMVHVQGRDRSEASAEAEAMLERLVISGVKDSYPFQISGGQAQRVAIARALLMKPDFLFLDEPTSALDARTTEDFAQWLCSLREQTNFVVVTHDILFARSVAGYGVYLSGGRVLDTGNIEQIIEHVRAGKLVGGVAGRGAD